jgi:thiol-disulfide isomerase/thioredoxin
MNNDYPNRYRRNKIIAGAVGITAIGLGAATGWHRLRSTAPDDAVARFYAMSLPDASGKPFAFSGLAGRPLVVNFWATWCPPCVEEMPELSALYYERSVVGLKMIGIGIDSPARIADPPGTARARRRRPARGRRQHHHARAEAGGPHDARVVPHRHERTHEQRDAAPDGGAASRAGTRPTAGRPLPLTSAAALAPVANLAAAI